MSIEGTGDDLVVFAHGYGCDQNVWQKVRPAVSAMTKTVAFDTTGAGHSDLSHFQPSRRHAGLEGYACDLIDVCEELDARSITFVGHSVSAMIGVIAAVKKPDLFDSMVLITPSACYWNDGAYRGGFDRQQLDGLLELMGSNFSNWADVVAPIIMSNPYRPGLASELSQSFCRWNEPAAKHFGYLTFMSDCRSFLSSVRPDCLLLECTDDTIAPRSAVAHLHEALPSSGLVKLQAQGHCPHVSAPEETVHAITRYLRSRGRLKLNAA
ncbi:alpha/beta hydrolase [Rhizobium sp. RU33A]|uniref:alpha/beta fold hydrolase n=1 Tax=Rhizobium sp. RU33A TaxID=1907413 RepID=UPI00158CD8D7|nr:alpha/beta hydrolase [Rhizobium sp. RU33A]